VGSNIDNVPLVLIFLVFAVPFSFAHSLHWLKYQHYFLSDLLFFGTSVVHYTIPSPMPSRLP
jgi:hypothetical protein